MIKLSHWGPVSSSYTSWLWARFPRQWNWEEEVRSSSFVFYFCPCWDLPVSSSLSVHCRSSKFQCFLLTFSATMGISLSCPFTKYIEMENGFGAILIKSLCTANKEAKTLVRSYLYRDQDSQPVIMKSTRNMTALEVSASFKTKEPNNTDSTNTKLEGVQSPTSVISFLLDPLNPEHEAATKLQKVYKSFRTRRKLADCAVLVQQRWFVIVYSCKYFLVWLFCPSVFSVSNLDTFW